jgi:hypothetical protein
LDLEPGAGIKFSLAATWNIDQKTNHVIQHLAQLLPLEDEILLKQPKMFVFK